MELNQDINDITNKLFRQNVDFVYEEILSQFINNNGNCKSSTFWLINWGIIFDRRNDGIKSFKKNMFKNYSRKRLIIFCL